jgi:hypothetical protein
MPAAVACWVETSTPPVAMAGRSSGHTAQSSVLTGGTIEERKGQSLLAESQEQGSRQSDSTPVLTLDETLTGTTPRRDCRHLREQAARQRRSPTEKLRAERLN